jgi:hypothetical protein
LLSNLYSLCLSLFKSTPSWTPCNWVFFLRWFCCFITSFLIWTNTFTSSCFCPLTVLDFEPAWYLTSQRQHESKVQQTSLLKISMSLKKISYLQRKYFHISTRSCCLRKNYW